LKVADEAHNMLVKKCIEYDANNDCFVVKKKLKSIALVSPEDGILCTEEFDHDQLDWIRMLLKI
jgi:hypothetical protein